MDLKVIIVCLCTALFAGFIHGTIGMGFGMIAMATVTLFLPYNNAAATVSVALMVLVSQVSITLRRHIDWHGILIPATALTLGKMLGIVLMMHLQTVYLRVSLGCFLILYSSLQLLNVKALKIKGTQLQGIVTCGLGGLFGGVFNVSGPFASIFCQARYGSDPKAYAANMNAMFVPSAFIAIVMHIWYGNFTLSCLVGSAAMIPGILVAAYAGVSVLRKIKVQSLFRLSHIYIIIMGLVICISG